MAQFSISAPEGLDTPACFVDYDLLQANVDRYAEYMLARDVRLRPHVKTHKCLQIVDMQIASGAAGLTVATLEEAEFLATRDYEDILIAYPVWLGNTHKRERYQRIERQTDVTIGVDSVVGLENLAAASRRSKPGAFIEIDSGQRRSGVTPQQALLLAQEADRLGVAVGGIFTHGGHAYLGHPHAAGVDEISKLEEAKTLLDEAGFPADIVSAGSTPTTLISAVSPVNEQRPGIYVFGDRTQVKLKAFHPRHIAFGVATTVVSRHRDRFILDAGSKTLSSDRPSWMDGFGTIVELPEATIVSLSEHHAIVETQETTPKIGDVVTVIPNHVCHAVNLVDSLIIVSKGSQIDEWPVGMRGLNR